MAVAAQLAAESMVLLKNDNQILPLTNKKKIAVVGPMAKMVGTYWVPGADMEKIRMWKCFMMG